MDAFWAGMAILLDPYMLGVILAGTIQQKPQAAQGLSLHAAKSTVTIVARRVDQNAHAADSRALSNILCIVDIIAGRNVRCWC